MGEIEAYSKARKLENFPYEKAALLVIDMQNFFLDEKSHAFVPSAKAIVPAIGKLANEFRKLGRPVAFTRYALKKGEKDLAMEKLWDGAVEEGSNASKIIGELEISGNDIIIRKTNYSSFKNSDLEKILRENNVENIVITGVMTGICCETAAREAVLRNFTPYFVIDATATMNEKLHLASLLSVSHGVAIPVTTGQIMESLKSVGKNEMKLYQ